MLYLGTSGWSYKHWGEKFYPKDLPDNQKLTFLAQSFPTVEVNTSFYHLPLEKTFHNWHDQTPPEFRFAVKVSRTITHLKRFDNVHEDWQLLIQNAAALQDKLGVYLVQCPPSFKATAEIIARLESFLEYAQTPGTRLAFELRHATWFEPEQLQLFERHQLCLVQAESSRFPHSPAGFSPAPFAYYRFHGPRQLYSSAYTDDELAYWANLIQAELAAGKDTFVYFDNDVNGYAVDDAHRLRQLLEK